MHEKGMKFLKHNFTSAALVSVLVISVFTLLFAASISYNQIKTLKNSQESVVRSYKIYIELEQLNAYASEAETGQRGFILTRDSTFLHPYYEALEKVKWSFARLNMLTGDNYLDKSNLDTLVYLVNQRFTFLDHVMKSSDNVIYAPDTLRRLMLRGKDLMALTLSQIDRMIFNELQLLKKEEQIQANKIKISPVAILFVVLFAVLVFIISFFRINREIREMTRTNNQLTVRNRYFEFSEQMADVSHWYWDIRENKLTYSPNFYRLLGCRSYEFEPTFENFLEYVHPADRHIIVERNKNIMAGMSSSVISYRILRKDGEIRYFKSFDRTISDHGRGISIGVNTDITEQYKKEKSMKDKLNDLERSNRQLSAFSHIASHDLQEPLRKVQIFISRIRENDINLPENIREYLSGVRKETVRMQKFITDLLLYSRASKADKTFERADLNEILENSKRELIHRIEEKNVIINSVTDLPVLHVIPFQIQQMFSNLISNSIKYSKPERKPMIDITSEIVSGKDVPEYNGDGDNRFYKITFSDNGIGFDQQYSEKIFTLFYRLHSNKDYSGTGIGLAICRIIAENHKGFIFATGIPDVGSTFNIYLPCK
jgi:signal transduction histidine kinase/CHASE3 domain sensor protein